MEEEKKHDDNGFSEQLKKDDKKLSHETSGKKPWKRDWHGNKKKPFWKNKNKGKREEETRIDYSKYDAQSKKQTLNLEILETARIEQHGLFPLAGKPLPKKSIEIDPFPEVKAIANSATANIVNNFATADINLYNEQSDTMDYITIGMDVSTYAQLPTPEWNSDNNNQNWVFNGWDEDFHTYTTQRAVQLAQQLTLITSSMQTNTAFAGLVALTYALVPGPHHINPFWNQYQHLGILGLIDGVNTMMLCAVTMYRKIKRNIVLLDYFTKKHPQFASALQIAKGMFKIKRFLAVMDTIKFDLSYFFCDVEWVDNKSKLLNTLTRYDESIYSPVIIPHVVISQPAYQIGLDNGNGPFFSMNITNGNMDGDEPYFHDHMIFQLENNLPGTEYLIQQLQEAVYNDGDPQNANFAQTAQQTAQDWYEQQYNDMLTLSQEIQRFKTQIAAYTSFMIQATTAGLISYKRTTWEWDIDLDIKYVPEIAIPLKHPECTITSSPNASGQYSAGIILEGDHVEKSLVDSTRWYSFSMESFFLAAPNNFNNNMRNYVLTLQFDDFNADTYDGGDIDNAAMAANNTLTSVYQLPEVAIYSWQYVYFLNGTQASFYAYTTLGRQLVAVSANAYAHALVDSVTNDLSIRGMWVLSDGSYYSNNDHGATYYYYLNYGFSGQAEAIEVTSWWTTGFKNLIDMMGIMSTTTNRAVNINDTPTNLGSYSISQDYTVGILVSMRTVYSEMRAETIKRLRLVEPLSPNSVSTMGLVPLH